MRTARPFLQVLKKLLLFLLFYLLSQSILAQDHQVNFAPTLETIDREQAEKMAVFQSYENFKEARLFRRADSSYFLEIYTTQDGETRRRSISKSEEEVQALRSEIEVKLQEDPSIGILNHEGRPQLIGGSIFLGLNYGSSLGTILSDDGSNFSIASPLLVSGGLTMATVLSTKDKEVTRAMGSMALNGGIIGQGHGSLLYTLWNPEDISRDASLTMSTLVSIAEGWSYYSVAKNNNFSPGRGAMWNFGNTWGALYGFGLTVLLTGSQENSTSPISFGGLAGSGLGIWMSQKIYRKYPHTIGNVRATRTLSTIGALLGTGILVSSDINDEARPSAITLLSTTALGTALGFSITNDYKLSSDQGWNLTLGSLGGGLIGSGISALVSGGTEGTIYMATAGAVGGFVTVFSSMKNDLSRGDKSMGKIDSRESSKLSWSINPAPLFYKDKRSDRLPTLRDVKANSMVHLNYRF